VRDAACPISTKGRGGGGGQAHRELRGVGLLRDAGQERLGDGCEGRGLGRARDGGRREEGAERVEQARRREVAAGRGRARAGERGEPDGRGREERVERLEAECVEEVRHVLHLPVPGRDAFLVSHAARSGHFGARVCAAANSGCVWGGCDLRKRWREGARYNQVIAEAGVFGLEEKVDEEIGGR